MSLMRDKNLILTNFRRHQRTGPLAPAVKNRQRLTQRDKMFDVALQGLSETWRELDDGEMTAFLSR